MGIPCLLLSLPSQYSVPCCIFLPRVVCGQLAGCSGRGRHDDAVPAHRRRAARLASTHRLDKNAVCAIYFIMFIKNKLLPKCAVLCSDNPARRRVVVDATPGDNDGGGCGLVGAMCCDALAGAVDAQHALEDECYREDLGCTKSLHNLTDSRTSCRVSNTMTR